MNQKVLLFGIVAAVMTTAGCTCRDDLNLAQGELRFGLVGSTALTLEGDFDLGETVEGRSLEVPIIFANTGSSALIVEGGSEVAGDGATVGGESATTPFWLKLGRLEIPPSGEARVMAVFTPPLPAAKRDYTTELALNVAGKEAPAKVVLRARAQRLLVTVPELLDFGAVVRGESLTLPLVIVNDSDTAQRFTVGRISQQSTPFARDSSPETFDVRAKGSRQVAITFTPTEIGDFFADLQVRSPASATPIRVVMLGTGTDTTLSVTPRPLDFNFALPGTEVKRTLKVQNWSAKEFDVRSFVATEGGRPSANFFAPDMVEGKVPRNTRGSNREIVPGEFEIEVTFRPTSALGRRTGELQFSTSLDLQPTVRTPLVGIAGGPDIDIRTPLYMGRIAYYPAATVPSSSSRRLVINNTGTPLSPPDSKVNLRFGKGGQGTEYWKVEAANANTSVDELCVGASSEASCPNTLPMTYDPSEGVAPRGRIELSLRATPRSLGDKAWKVTFYSNDPDEPEYVLDVTANAVVLPPCNLEVVPTQLNFGVLSPPSFKDMTFVMRNRGTGAGDECLITNIDLDPAGDEGFGVIAAVEDEVILGPGEDRTIVVRGAPTRTANGFETLTNRVRFNVNSDTAPERSVGLTMLLGQSCLFMNPTVVQFGNVKLGCNSNERSVSVYNGCTESVSIQSVQLVNSSLVPNGTAGCTQAAGCPEFFLTNIANVVGTLRAGDAPRVFSVRYRPLDVGADTGSVRLRATQTGNTVDYIVPLQGTGSTTGTNTDIFRQDSQAKSDILMVVDDSCSMGDDQIIIANNIPDFIQELSSSNSDWQMGVTTMDIDGSDYENGRQGHFVKKGRDGSTLPTIYRRNTINLRPNLEKAIIRGSMGAGREPCFEPTVMAITNPVLQSDHPGFIRPDANLAIICLSDGDDMDGFGTKPPVTQYVAQMLAVKGGRQQALTINGIVPVKQPSSPPPGCNYQSPPPANRYLEAGRLTGGIMEEICTNDWRSTLKNIAKSALGSRTAFTLTAPVDFTKTPPLRVYIRDCTSCPERELPEVDMRGTPIWQYDFESNSLSMAPLYIPPPGAELRVQYDTQCL